MDTKKMTSLEERKKQLEAELNQIQVNLEKTIGDFKEDVQKKTSPAFWIRKYPLGALSAAFVFGFLIAGGKKKQTDGSRQISYSEPGVGGMISGELKRALVQRATHFLMDKVDDLVEKKASERKKEMPEKG